MPTFAAIGFDHPPHSMALRDAHRAAHRKYVLEHAAPIRIRRLLQAPLDNIKQRKSLIAPWSGDGMTRSRSNIR